MSDLEIIGAPQSNYVRSVRIACEEKGVAYKLVVVRPHTPDVDAIHPFGKIPVMRHGDFTLCESKAIATYVDRTFAGPKLFPDDAKLGTKIEQWVSLENTTIIPATNNYLAYYFFRKLPDGSLDHAAIDAALPDAKKALEVLNAAASDGFLAGDMFTYADMNILPVLAYLRELPETGEIMKSLRHLTRYFETHAERPSFKATIPPPFSALPLR
ncbi:MAG TPA: glutathione S-transferase family protein [Rhizomicrobium sp.]|jgi:glutathione S-transferase|nr:glutathione S-transferase family protein [Rhizomicrobium sp.]